MLGAAQLPAAVPQAGTVAPAQLVPAPGDEGVLAVVAAVPGDAEAAESEENTDDAAERDAARSAAAASLLQSAEATAIGEQLAVLPLQQAQLLLAMQPGKHSRDGATGSAEWTVEDAEGSDGFERFRYPLEPQPQQLQQLQLLHAAQGAQRRGTGRSPPRSGAALPGRQQPEPAPAAGALGRLDMGEGLAIPVSPIAVRPPAAAAAAAVGEAARMPVSGRGVGFELEAELHAAAPGSRKAAVSGGDGGAGAASAAPRNASSGTAAALQASTSDRRVADAAAATSATRPLSLPLQAAGRRHAGLLAGQPDMPTPAFSGTARSSNSVHSGRAQPAAAAQARTPTGGGGSGSEGRGVGAAVSAAPTASPLQHHRSSLRAALARGDEARVVALVQTVETGVTAEDVDYARSTGASPWLVTLLSKAVDAPQAVAASPATGQPQQISEEGGPQPLQQAGGKAGGSPAAPATPEQAARAQAGHGPAAVGSSPSAQAVQRLLSGRI